MKSTTLASILLLIMTSSFCFAANDTCGDIQVAIETIKRAIVNGNPKQITPYIGEGLWVGDASYSRKKVLAMLENKNSWLYQCLFGAKDSMRQQISTGVTKIQIQSIDRANIIQIIPQKQDGFPPTINLMCIDGQWRLTDIYYF